MTQSFFARFLERGKVRLAEESRRRFRTFLLKSLDHFLVNEWEKSRAARRGGQFAFGSAAQICQRCLGFVPANLGI